MTSVKCDGVDVQIEPGEPDVKLFIVDGFTLKVEVCEDGDEVEEGDADVEGVFEPWLVVWETFQETSQWVGE